VPGESVIWYQQQVEIIGDRGRIWVSLNQGWTLWRNGRIRQGSTGWPADDGVAQQALFVDLRRVLHAKGDRWRSFATGVATAALRQRVMDGCISSARQGIRMPL
jgi:predicted dehydrogenase